MALDSGKPQGKGIKTALVGAGLGLTSLIGWNVLDSKPNSGEIVQPEEDTDSEAKKKPEDKKDPEVAKDIAIRMEDVNAKALQQLKIPLKLPPLKGVKGPLYQDPYQPQNPSQEEVKEFLGDVDQWLYVAAPPASEEQVKWEERAYKYGSASKARIESTRRTIERHPVLLEVKRKIEAAFPNYLVLASNHYGDGLALAIKPGLTMDYKKTMTGFSPIGGYTGEWYIYADDEKGAIGAVYYPGKGGPKHFGGSIDDLIIGIGTEMTKEYLRNRYNNEEMVEQYEQQGFK